MNNLAEWLAGMAAMGGGAGGGFFALRWLVHWLTARHDARQARLDAERGELDQGWKSYRLVLEKRLADHERQIGRLTKQVEAARLALHRVSGGLIELNPAHPALGEAARIMNIAFPVDFALETAAAEAALRQSRGEKG